MISILLASYNGEKYIAQQIESILTQTEQNFIIYVNDDCSSDSTYEIEKKYEAMYPDKIKVTRNKKNSGNAKYNFINMMIEHKDDYVMLCDQDDVWLPNKIEITLKKMKSMERRFGKEKPALVHTDLVVVDEKLNVISKSFKKMMNANYDRTKLNNIIIQNTVTGCTAMYNRALAELIIKPKGFFVMHDWWIAVIASAFGNMGHIDYKTILYRQHGKNSIGVRNMKSFKFIINYMFKVGSIKRAIAETYFQAKSLYITYSSKLSKEQKKFLFEYININRKNKFLKILNIFKLNVFKNGFLRNIGYFIYI